MIPLFLLTGFLGSGKTTLLSRLIRSDGFRDTAVIINEFGAVGLDHVLVAKGEESRALLLDSGCLCCAMDGSLATTLERLYYDRERGEIPRFDRVVIETSGLAEPGLIVNALHIDRFMARRFSLAGIIVTVDAVFGPRQLQEFVEASVQLAMADRVILTKIDLADADLREQARSAIRALNPHASLFEAAGGNLDAARLLDTSGLRGDGLADTPHGHEDGHDHHHEHDHIHAHGIAARVLHCPQTVSWTSYADWVRFLQSGLGSRLLRLKGILRLEDGQPHAVHGVQHLFSPPETLSAATPSEIIGNVVLIARDVGDDEIQAAAQLIGAAVIRA
ncbi:GTP-binding protein [Azospirillum sp. YIM B02556]|uniref:GTP-binding protein n=1 Tax=Azospirillum endophyticum TaxID=2800326 RepID=A0ABS1FF66_9PROT|nr:CobW family GTP-binding protein [Azospirillum endophyticum]MBK1842077.1 GTP-binding protein [Azospirillum endophyticum]